MRDMELKISNLMRDLRLYWEQNQERYGQLSDDTLNISLQNLHYLRRLVDEVETLKSKKRLQI